MGEPVRAEDLGPFVEWQVSGDQDGAPLVALGKRARRRLVTLDTSRLRQQPNL